MSEYAAFLCHASRDKEWAEKLAERLESRGIRCFFDKEELRAGDRVISRLSKALDASRAMVILLGGEIGQYQEREIEIGLRRNLKNNDFRIVPVLLPGTDEDDIPEFLKDYKRIAFENGPVDDARLQRLIDGIDSNPTGETRPLKPQIEDLRQLRVLAVERLRELLYSRKRRVRSEFVQKYDPRVYYPREGTEELFQDFLYQEEKKCFVVIGKAGKGKTNLLCHLAEKLPNQVGEYLPLLLSATELHIEAKGLTASIESALVGGARGRLSPLGFTLICQYLKEQSARLIVFIDGINELEGTEAFESFSRELNALLDDVDEHELPVLFCLSCRSEIWHRFRNQDWAQQDIFGKWRSGDGVGSASLELGDFPLDKIDEIAQRYFRWYAIEAKLIRSARRNCCDPIMLRYLCAAHTRRAPADWDKPPSQIPKRRVGTIETLRRKEVFDLFVENRRTSMAMVARKSHNVHDERMVDKLTTRYLIEMAYEMYRQGRSHLKVADAIAIAHQLDHPDAEEAKRGKEFFLRGDRSVFFRFIDEGIILSKISDDTFNFVFESYFEYSLGRYLSRVRWPGLYRKGKEKAVLDDLCNLMEKHEKLFETKQFNNIFGALHYAILDLEQRPIRNCREDFFIELIEAMSRSSGRGFDWVQLACATLRETEIAQPLSRKSQAIGEAEEATRQRRFERLLGVLDHLTLTSEFLLIWDLETTLVSLAAAHRDITLGRIREWAESDGRYLQRIFAFHSLARLFPRHTEQVAEILLDLMKDGTYFEDFWLARSWIGAVRAAADQGKLSESLRPRFHGIIERMATESKHATVRAQAIANLPLLVSSRPTALERVKGRLAEEDWPWAQWNLAFELRFWKMDYGRSWPWQMLETLVETENQHLRYVIESTVQKIAESDPDAALRIRRRLRGSFWRLDDEDAGDKDERLGIAYSPAFLEPAYDNHVECRERLQVILSLLERVGKSHFTWIKPRRARPEELLPAHQKEIDQHRDRSAWLHYVEDVKEMSESLESQPSSLRLRTGPSELRYESYDVARLSAGAAIRAVDYVLGSPARFAMALNRPPGHLANNTICIFNNIAIAAHAAKKKDPAIQRIFILDFDAHHGLHTHRAFRRDPETVYCSIHIDGEYAKRAGLPRHTGTRAGVGYNFNINYPKMMGDEGYAYIVEAFLIPLIRQFNPDLILLSAGFDGHFDDPMTGGRLTEDAFIHLAKALKAVAEELDVKIAGTFEGGYGLEGMMRSLVHMLSALGGWPSDPDEIGWTNPSTLPEDPDPDATRRRVREVVRERVRYMAARARRTPTYDFDMEAACWQKILSGD